MSKTWALGEFAREATRLRAIWRKIRPALQRLMPALHLRGGLRGIAFPLSGNSQRTEIFQGELAFWDAELSLKGQYAEFTRKRIDPSLRKEEFPTTIFDLIIPLLEQRFGPARPFKCVEIGSGPLSNLAYGVDIGLLDVTAVDPLAEEYAYLYDKYHLEDYPVKPIAGCGEILDGMFGEETFHCAYARNALDHTEDIQKTFRNLVHVTKTGGYVILQHAVREGSWNKWTELHRWDLDLVSKGLIAMDRKEREIPLMEGCPVEFAIIAYQSVEHARWMDVVLKKVFRTT